MLKLFIVFFCLLPFTGWSKDYRVRLEVKNLPADSQPILLRFYNGALFALDTLPVAHKIPCLSRYRRLLLPEH